MTVLIFLIGSLIGKFIYTYFLILGITFYQFFIFIVISCCFFECYENSNRKFDIYILFFNFFVSNLFWAYFPSVVYAALFDSFISIVLYRRNSIDISFLFLLMSIINIMCYYGLIPDYEMRGASYIEFNRSDILALLCHMCCIVISFDFFEKGKDRERVYPDLCLYRY
jgi:hypothetical protein